MAIAALITWIAAAAGGFYLLATWYARGGARAGEDNPSRFPAALIFGHFVLAAAGLVVWIVYLVAAAMALAWTALIILVVVAILGFTMFARWLSVSKAPAAATESGGTDGGGTSAGGTPAEAGFPSVVVYGHGLLAVATAVLVLLVVLGVG